jgi:agmatinase
MVDEERMLTEPSRLLPKLILDELSAYLRPPGQGIHAVSSGKQELEAQTRAYLGITDDKINLRDYWRRHLEAIPKLAQRDAVALLAIPCDTGAGLVRGANRGPEALRRKLGKAPVFDLGDVFCVPHFLSEESLSETQRARTQAAIYPERTAEERRDMPVSPLGIAERVYELLGALNPQLRILLIGGDHSVSWPALNALLSRSAKDAAIVHFDAHTDLLPERLGVMFCFATWAYHANEKLGRGERLLQLGIRASGKKRDHWEGQLGVRQIWADDALKQTPEQLGRTVVAHLKAIGAKRVYLTNDIDGTDSHWAAACGTPEPGGLTPDHVEAVIDAVAKGGFELLGADVVEVAPGLSLSKEAAERTVETATRYLRAEIRLLQSGR